MRLVAPSGYETSGQPLSQVDFRGAPATKVCQVLKELRDSKSHGDIVSLNLVKSTAGLHLVDFANAAKSDPDGQAEDLTQPAVTS